MQPETLDPQVVNLAKAIRQTESKGDFNAKGGSGEWGGYQYTKDTWDADNKAFGTNYAYGSATPQQQNEVAYKKIKSLKDKGYNVGQIASIWNSGKPEWEGNVWVNKYGVKYDTPAYVNSVAQTYQQYKQGNQSFQGVPNPSTVNGGGTFSQAIDQIQKDNPQLQEPKKDGVVKSVIKSLVGSPLTILARPFQAAAAIGGKTNEEIDAATKKIPVIGGLIAPTPKGAKDVGKDVLRAGETVAEGYMAVKGAGLLAKSLRGGTALASEPVTSMLTKYAGKEAISSLSAAEKVEAISQILAKGAGGNQAVFQKALQELAPQVLREAGVGTFAELNPAIAKAIGLSGTALKALFKYGLQIAGAASLYDIANKK